LRIATSKQARSLIDSFDTFLLDCDGVIWEGNRLLDGAKQTLDLLRHLGKRLIFVTNNSTLSRQQYLKKFEKLRLHAQQDEIFGSSRVLAYYLRHVLHFPQHEKVYVVGQNGIMEELVAEGIQCFTDEAEEMTRPVEPSELAHIQRDDTVGAVVIGFDIQVNYRKLARAFTYLTNPKCQFIATNTDATYPYAGSVFPGTGAIVASLEKATGRTPVVVGKPCSIMMDYIVQKIHLDRAKTCMIGDRLDTDILFGLNGGMHTMLVLTGVTKEDELLKEDQAILPHYYVDSLGKLAWLYQDA